MPVRVEYGGRRSDIDAVAVVVDGDVNLVTPVVSPSTSMRITAPELSVVAISVVASMVMVQAMA